MKKILFALLTGWMAISFTACDDFLTETPSTSVPTEEALVTTQDFQNALNGVYYTLGSYRFLGRDVLAINWDSFRWGISIYLHICYTVYVCILNKGVKTR